MARQQRAAPMPEGQHADESRRKPKEIVEESQRIHPKLLKVALWVGMPLIALGILVFYWFFLSGDDPSPHGNGPSSTQTVLVVYQQPAVQQAPINVLQLAAAGRSERIPNLYRKRVKMSGKDFHMHCVYADNRAEESFVP